jgi:choline kinase
VINVLMPMAGLGSRFRAAGIDIPKPLITVDGKPMFARALDSFAGREISLTVVVRQEDEDAYGLRREIYRFARHPTSLITMVASSSWTVTSRSPVRATSLT